MKNSFIIINGASKNQELMKKTTLNRKSFKVSNEFEDTPKSAIPPNDAPKVKNLHIVRDKRPSARDGHTGLIVTGGNGNNYLLIFGGDRHNNPFNDLHLLDIDVEMKHLL